MLKIKTLLFSLFLVSLTVNAQLSRQAMDSLKRISMPDYQNMLDQLGIKSLRPKPNPGTANYDEAKANQYANIPDALTLKNGKKIPNIYLHKNSGKKNGTAIIKHAFA